MAHRGIRVGRDDDSRRAPPNRPRRGRTFQCRTRGDQLVIGELLQFRAQGFAPGSEGRLECDHGRSTRLDGAVVGDLDQPDRLDRAVRGLGCRQTVAGEQLACGVLGVDGVVLARKATLHGPRWAGDLVDLVALVA